MKRTLLVLFIVCTSLKSSAIAPIIGGKMGYESLGSNKYKIIATLYRDCRTASLTATAPVFGVYGGNNGSTSCGSYSLTGFTRVSIRDVSSVCSTATKPCNPANTSATGEGVEEHVFTATVDFNASPLSNFTGKSSCCEVTFYVDFAGNNTVNSTSCDFVVKCMINICNIKKTPRSNNQNNSPKLTNLPVNFLCCNQAVYFNPGWIDTTDKDSFLIRQNCPFCSVSSAWPGGNCTIPLTPWCNPPTTIKCSPNIKTDPPRGFFFDTTLGDFIFTPTNCLEYAPLVSQLKEFRKDSSGKWLNIGYTMIDYRVYIQDDCGYNKAPKISGPFRNSVCAGDKICFSIYGQDETFSPFQTTPDTVLMDWNGGIPGATFKITNPSDREKEATFCWQTSSSNASDIPYRFAVTASDQHCTKAAKSSRGFIIKVNPKIDGAYSFKKTNCGTLILLGTGDSAYPVAQNYNWKITDSLGKIILNSSNRNDTIKNLRGGKYYISFTINSVFNCPLKFSDSVRMPELPRIWIGNDTFACFNSTFKAEIIKSVFAHKPLKYQWSNPTSVNVADTFSYLNISKITKDTILILKLTDSLGCVAKDTQKILVKPLPKVNLGADQRICTYGSVQFDAQNADTVKYLWNTNEKTRKILAHIAGTYSVILTEKHFNCSNYDTANLFVNDTVKAFAGKDQNICVGDSNKIHAIALPNGYPIQYQWTWLQNSAVLGSNTDYTLKLDNPNGDGNPARIYLYGLRVIVTQQGLNCIAKDTVKITVNTKPLVRWTKSPLDPNCYNWGDIVLSSFISKPNSNLWDSSKLKLIASINSWNKKPLIFKGLHNFTYLVNNIDNKDLQNGNVVKNEFTITFTDTNGCVNSAKTSIIIAGKPLIEFKTTQYCQDLGEARIFDNVISPTNFNFINYQWELVSGPSGVNTDGLLIDKNSGTGNPPDYYLTFGNKQNTTFAGNYLIRLKSEDKTYHCQSNDTTTIIVRNEPSVKSKQSEITTCSGLLFTDVLKNISVWGLPEKPGIGNFDVLAKNGNRNDTNIKNITLDSGHYFPLKNNKGLWTLRYNKVENTCYGADSFDLLIHETPLVKSTQPQISMCEELKTNDLLNNITVWGLMEKPDSGLFEVIAKNNNRKDDDVKSFNLDSGHYFPLKNHIALWKLKYNKWENTCYGSDSFDLRVWPSPIASFITNPDNNVTKDFPNFLVTNKSSISDTSKLHYQWYFNYGIPEKSSTSAEPFISFPNSDAEYKIKLIAISNHNCRDTFYKILVVGKGTAGIQVIEKALFNINNNFVVAAENFSLQKILIFDMTGRLVYQAGDNNGVELKPGIYTYILELKNQSGKILNIRGKKLLN